MILNKPRFLTALCIVAPLILSGAGCAAPQNRLTMVSLDRRHDFQQFFSQAYSSLDDNGDYDIVLVHDANSDHLTSGNSDTLTPAPINPRQIVHIRVFWIADHGTKLDHPVATNAAIRWYLLGDRADETSNVLEYSGTALVLVNDDGKTANVTLRGATLKPIARRGQMADPLGPSSVTGTITAQVNRHGVEDILNEAKAVDDAGLLQAASVEKD
jgi:hypothetical protein